MTRIIGISAYYHDSAVALIEDGQVIAAVQEERFSRKKHDAGFPKKALQWMVDQYGLSSQNVDHFAFYDKPFLKFERLLESYYAFAPKGLPGFIRSMPVWIKEKLFLKDELIKELKSFDLYDRKKHKLLFPEHHLSHAASAFYPSGYEQAAILTIDGVGEWATASICKGSGSEIEILQELQFPHSLGLLYSAITYFLGFRVNSGEYKLMGLAPYGRKGNEAIEGYKRKIEEELCQLNEDGSLWLNQKYFSYATGLRMVPDRKWESLFSMKKREAETELQQEHCDLALAFQEFTEEVVMRMARHAMNLADSENLCMAGGVALNCVANGRILAEGLTKNLYVQPASGDAGGAVGAALAAYFLGAESKPGTEVMPHAYMGSDIYEKDIESCIRKYGAVAERLDDSALYEQTAKAISDGEVVGWVQARMEFGPRALGNRSILGDPRSEEMQRKINLKIKYRESFRPFAPAVLEEDQNKFFELDTSSPYMLLVAPVAQEIRESVPADYQSLPMRDKLYTKRSALPAITHVDFSARVQSVSAGTNPRFYQLIKAFKELTGTGVLINTSFNVRGEPIVCSPEDAYRCFMRTEMDRLVVGNFVFLKSDQPEWPESDNWKTSLNLD
jgi:carbamoyltransferase